jgi:hypothetical protein
MIPPSGERRNTMNKPLVAEIVLFVVLVCLMVEPGLSQTFYMCGDANDDGTVDIGDAVYLVAYIFESGPPPSPYPVASGDADGSCQVDVDDVCYIIQYIFSGGPPCYLRVWWIVDCGECIPGDVNFDGLVDPDDIAHIEFCITHPDFCPGFPPCCADVDDSGAFDVDDVVYLTNYVYSGGPEPVPSSMCLY